MAERVSRELIDVGRLYILCNDYMCTLAVKDEHTEIVKKSMILLYSSGRPPRYDPGCCSHLSPNKPN